MAATVAATCLVVSCSSSAEEKPKVTDPVPVFLAWHGVLAVGG